MLETGTFQVNLLDAASCAAAGWESSGFGDLATGGREPGYRPLWSLTTTRRVAAGCTRPPGGAEDRQNREVLISGFDDGKDPRTPLFQGPYRAVGPSRVQRDALPCRALPGQNRNLALFLSVVLFF